MATYDHAVTANDIIRDALLNVGAIDEDEVVSGTAATDALRRLNNMIKSWQGRFHLWTREEAVLPLVKSANEYALGPAATDAEWCDASQFKTTTLTAAAVATATALTVASTADLAVDKRVGIELADGTRQWTTVKAITSTTAFTLTAALTGAASSGATVFAYTTRPQRPLRILQCRRGAYNGSEIPVEVEALEVYFRQPNKTSTGVPTIVSYKPTLGAGRFYTWPAGSSVNNVLRFTYEKPLADFDLTSEAPDFPIEWAEPIVLNLSVLLDRQYRQIPADRRRELIAQAKFELDRIERGDSDFGSVYFQPAYRR